MEAGSKLPSVAIDGPAGAGKSTVAQLLAKRLKFTYIDTGAMYRALTWKALQKGVDLRDEGALTRLAADTSIELTAIGDGALKVYCDGEDITEEIRKPAVSQWVSIVAKVPEVRRRMVELQRRMGQRGGVVMDGRDIGSQVLPDAEYKFFLTASLEERTKRRCLELKMRGFTYDEKRIKEELEERDWLDTHREAGPLVKVPEAVLVDTTGCSVEQVVEKMLEIIRRGEK